MNIAYKAYNLLTTGLFLPLFPAFWLYSRISGRYTESINQRLGFYPHELVGRISGSPIIWIHAVSVGEVSVAAAIIESLISFMPESAIILSTTTEHGQVYARKKLQSVATCIYAPIDFIVSARKALTAIKPDILVCLETEIWPNWLVEAHRMGIKTALVNGRISVRTIKRYLKIRPLMRETLKHVDAFSMIREEDAQRIKMIGAPPARIEINGNAKYDILLNQTDTHIIKKMKSLYNLYGDRPVFLAGSIRSPEEKIILEVYRKIVEFIPETLLIIAPRHIERSRHINDMFKDKGFSCQFRTDLNKENCLRAASVIILDTIGDLQDAYSIASVVFCGGSLVSLGGQNILEAAVWGKPVFYGPSMEDFLDAKELLDKIGGGIQVKDGRELAEKVIYYLGNPEQADVVGGLARKAVLSNKGSADKHAVVIYKLLANNRAAKSVSL